MRSRLPLGPLSLLSGALLLILPAAPAAAQTQSSSGCGQAIQHASKQAHLDRLTMLYKNLGVIPKVNFAQDYRLQDQQNNLNQIGSQSDLFKSLWPSIQQLLTGMTGMGGLAQLANQMNNSSCSSNTQTCAASVTAALQQLVNNGCLINTSSCLLQAQSALLSVAGNQSSASSATASYNPLSGMIDATTGAACMAGTASGASCGTQMTALLTSLANANCGANACSGSTSGSSGGGGSSGSGSSGSGSGGGSAGNQSAMLNGFKIPTPQQIVGQIGSTSGCSTQAYTQQSFVEQTP